MPNQEAAMLAYVQLAVVSHERNQALARDRFLLLAGASACRAAWPEVAEQVRQVLAQTSPHHALSRFHSFTDALRDDSFQTLVTRLEQSCPFERAEHLLATSETPVPEIPTESGAGGWALQQVARLRDARASDRTAED